MKNLIIAIFLGLVSVARVQAMEEPSSQYAPSLTLQGNGDIFVPHSQFENRRMQIQNRTPHATLAVLHAITSGGKRTYVTSDLQRQNAGVRSLQGKVKKASLIVRSDDPAVNSWIESFARWANIPQLEVALYPSSKSKVFTIKVHEDDSKSCVQCDDGRTYFFNKKECQQVKEIDR